MDDLPRLSKNEALILELLSARQRAYGLELVEESDGRLKRGSVYVTLSRMEDKGYVESWTEPAAEGEQGPPRRRYRIAGLGARVMAAQGAYEAVLQAAWGVAT